MKIQSTLLALLFTAAAGFAQDHWVATWTTAQPMIRPVPPPVNPNAPANPAPPRAGMGGRGFTNQTVRMLVHTSVGGTKVRIKLTAPFGGTPVDIGSAHIALLDKGSDIVAASDHALTFNGAAATIIRPGQVILSDAVEMAVPKQGEIAVSVFFPTDTGAPSAHNELRTNYLATQEGDLTATPSLGETTSLNMYYYLQAVDVLAPKDAELIVAFGDSITEGARSTPDTGNTWPKVLAARLAANKATANFGVANMGIGGNRVLRDGTGASSLARFDRDVLGQSGVKWVMMIEGINDIGRVNTDHITAEQLIGAYKQLIDRAHAQGVKMVGCTLTPYMGAGYSTPEGEAVRAALNDWMRTSGAFDAVVDFEAATKDTADAKRIKPDFDPGDHLHPNDAGYKAMGDAVDLKIFTGKKK